MLPKAPEDKNHHSLESLAYSTQAYKNQKKKK